MDSEHRTHLRAHAGSRRLRRIPTPHLIRCGLVAAAIAVITNSLIYAAGRAAGLEFVIQRVAGAPARTVEITNVVGATVSSFAIGLLVAAAANRLRPTLMPAIRAAAVLLAVASLGEDVVIDAATVAKATLGTMHLVAGCAFAVAVTVASKPRASGSDPMPASTSTRTPAAA